ncbi:MAG: ABC transporter permease [Rhodobacteraceae bacterium]|nr:ABC transporter permease [Paracoccaceae bacterium]
MTETETATPGLRQRVLAGLAILASRPGAALAFLYLLAVVAAAIAGPPFFADSAEAIDFKARNLPPLSLEPSWHYLLGSDSIGRPSLDRLLVSARSTLLISLVAVALSAAAGVLLGLVAGLRGGFAAAAIMRVCDALMSFPTLLLAILLLYVVKSSVGTVVLVLAVSRLALFIRVTRAETAEVRGRVYVTASRAIGARPGWITRVHLLPALVPTLVTLFAVEVAFTMLAESSLSFIGIGVQPPGVSWGLMVAQGRDYLATQWWLSFWPGLAIVLTALSLVVVANLMKTALDPRQKWRLQM